MADDDDDDDNDGPEPAADAAAALTAALVTAWDDEPNAPAADDDDVPVDNNTKVGSSCNPRCRSRLAAASFSLFAFKTSSTSTALN